MKRTILYLTTCATLLAHSALLTSSESDPFSELDAATSAGSEPEQDYKDFESYRKAHLAEFDAYKRKLMEEFAEYKKIAEEENQKYERQLKEVWDTPEMSSKKVWIEYSGDLKSKSRVDFENQNVSISATVKPGASLSRAEIRARLKRLLMKDQAQAFEDDTLAQAIEKRSKEKISLLETAKVKPKPILLPLVSDKEKPSDKEVEAIVDRMMEEKKESKAVNKKGETVITVKVAIKKDPQPAEPARKSKTSGSGNGDTATDKKSARVPSRQQPREMVDTEVNKLPRGARQIASDVGRFAHESKLDKELVFAIIETESAFNPMAKSPIPAYGLMQIVPRSAGMDATEQLFGKGRILSPSYLYTQDKNIEIGATYLNILYYRYLKGITNPQSRLYCSIAAYNTGAGNVAKAFTGKMRLRDATPKINQMSPQQVYDFLVENLPYDETRKYLQKVVSRIPNYSV